MSHSTVQLNGHSPARRIGLTIAMIGGLCGLAAMNGGCQFGALLGGMAENSMRDSTKWIEAEYTGLNGKTFAVVVNADRSIQAEHSAVIAKISMDAAERLWKHTEAGGYIPGQKLLQYQFDNPRTAMMSPSELGRALGVERLIVIDISEYRLTDRGNAYLWNGVARASVRVVEIDSTTPDDFAFTATVAVKYPDKEGYGREDKKMEEINSLLVRRFVDRATWLFYRHEEKYRQEY